MNRHKFFVNYRDDNAEVEFEYAGTVYKAKFRLDDEWELSGLYQKNGPDLGNAYEFDPAIISELTDATRHAVKFFEDETGEVIDAPYTE